jgi:hypothetical protein
MTLFVDDWAAADGSAYLVLPDDPGSASAALVEDGQTLGVHSGRVPSGVSGPIAFVDGVRRGEASPYQHDPTGALTRGVAAGHACGYVITRSGSRLEFGRTPIRRLIIWGGGLSAKLPEVSRGWAWHSVAIAYASPDAPLHELLAVAYFGHTMVGFTAVNLVAAGKTRAQLVILWTSLALNVGAGYVLIPRVGVVGAAVAPPLSLWSLNGLALLVMLFAIAYAAPSLLHAAARLPALVSLALFVIVCLGSMAVLYRSGRLIDAAGRDLLRATLERRPFRIPL